MNTQNSVINYTSEQVAQSTPTDLSKKQPSIVDVVETVQKLKDAYRPITQEERDLIASWPGWGAYRPAFELYPTDKWKMVAPQLRALLGMEGFDAASAATPTSYFTSPYISRAIWRLAELLGFSGGTVLEPGCGTGQVLSYAPASLDLHITGVEKEPFTASVAQLLFPEAHIINAPLQEVALTNESFDLAVGNVPFADIDIYDRTLPFKEKLSLHNYFIYRALAALRPGGIAILVTSRYTMDAMKPRTRQILSELGILLGAIRLPSHGHKWAKTAVITDILVLQRKYPNASWDGHDWSTLTDLSIHGTSISTNTYFAKHPQQILGTVSRGRGMYGNDELTIRAPEDLEGALEAAIKTIAEEVATHKSTYIPRVDRTQLNAQLAAQRGDGLKEGCFYQLKSLGLVEIVDGQAKKVNRNVAELTHLVRLRDTVLALLEAERDYSKSDEELIPLRTELNSVYDAYVHKYGFIRRSSVTKKISSETGEEKVSRRPATVMYQFRTDEHYPLLLGLENYDDETGKAQKAALFTQRINHPAVYKETAESREEAIALSLDRYGTLDFAFIARATGKAEDEIANYLGDLVYEDPETGAWEIAPNYLSGNVRKKLEVAQKALRSDPKWQRNVDALEKVLPEPIAPEDIKVLLGAPWIPVKYLIQFCHETLKMKPEIVRDKASGAWEVAPPLGIKLGAQATSVWGTSRVDGFKLVEHMLNHKVTRVEDLDLDGKSHVNTEETLLAQQKRKELQARFGEWIWEENIRTKELAALYNKIYNGVVSSNFNGDHLSFPGMDAYWQNHLYPWQRDFIARMINNRSALCAFPVGAGKTKIQVAGAMTLRRMKLISRAAILVPNHLLEQIASEAKQLYPAANILMIGRDDLSGEKRRIFMARIATGDHDLVIMTHSAFEAINVHPETKKEYIEERIREYKQILCGIRPNSSNNADKRLIKKIEKLLLRMHEQIKELLDTRRDPGITFEQLGISYLIVDEAHFFKNLGLPTNQEKLSVTPAKRAQDMLMKLRWLEKNNGSRPFASFFTATPISNSMVEAFVMLWYLNYEMLQDYGLACVDDFASMFIETETKTEVTPNGAGFRLYERPSNFINLPEFMHLFASIADIRPPDILADKRPDLLEHTISVDATPEVETCVDSLVERSDKLRRGELNFIDGKVDNMLWVTTDGRKAALWMGLHGIKEEFPAKLDAVATEMALVYRRWQEEASYLPGAYKSLQIGFCDMGTPNEEKGDQVYGELKRLLIQKCVPAQGIRFIHEAKTDSAKAALFEKCRTGEVAILLGSTSKLGTGTNIQTRCAAIHHIDAPWRPDEIEQRLGRGQRPGNLYPVVEVFYYVQKRTFDAYSWQILSNKAKFFNQIRSSTVVSREMSYSDDSALTYGQVKAAATGDILLLEHANVSLSADAYERLHSSFKRARERDKQEASAIREAIGTREDNLRRYQLIQNQVASYKGEHPFMTPSRLLLEKKEEQQEFIVNQIKSAIEKDIHTLRIVDFQGVSVFFKPAMCALTFHDPYTGIDVSCPAGLMEDENRSRFVGKIRHFFEHLSTEIEKKTGAILELRKTAEEFEQSAQAIFPHHEALQQALSRKRALDAYIHLAAEAKGDQDQKKLAKMREHLRASAPKELTERPKPKNTATCVLPPRRPEAETQKTSQVETKEIETETPTTKNEPQPVPVTAPSVAKVTKPSPVHQRKTEVEVKVVPVPSDVEVVESHQEKAEVTKAVKAVSKSSLVFGNIEHIKQARKRNSEQAPAKDATPSQAAKPKAEPKPVLVFSSPVVSVALHSQEKAEAKSQAAPVQSKSPLIFGNPEHIEQARKRSTKQTLAKAITPPQKVESKGEPRPAASPVVPTSQEKAETKSQAAPVQSKSPLIFGNPEHIEQARKRSTKQTLAKAITPPQKVESKGDPRPAASPVVPISQEKAEAKSQAAPVQSKSPLIFGNPEHIEQARKPRKTSKAGAKPAQKKKIIYAEWPACGVIEEEMPKTLAKAVPGQQRTLWDLIQAAA
jgi:N12 class adenine-specific DNA methylase